MVVDGSVLLAILLRAPDAARFDAALADVPVRLISAVTRAEVVCVIESRKGAPGRTALEQLLREGDLETAVVTPQQAHLAADAFRRFGSGRQLTALTLGDCFAYALAQTVGLPLLFRDERFRWEKRKPLVHEFDHLQVKIATRLAKDNGERAIELLWNFIGTADAMVDRVGGRTELGKP